MRIIETRGTITEDGKLVVPMPSDIVPGKHRVVIVIEEQPLVKEKTGPLGYTAYPINSMLADYSFPKMG